MARLLHDGHHMDDLCADMRDDGSGDCGCSGDHRDASGSDSGGRRRRRELIPVNNITVDCTPLSFKTEGQARNVVSCPVSQTVNVPVTQTTNVLVPTSFGCFECVPVTSTVEVPVTTTVNLPPTLVPFPRLICPPFATAGVAGTTVPTTMPSTVTSGCGCRG